MKRVCSPAYAGALVLTLVVVALFVGVNSAWPYSASDTQFYDGLSDLGAFEPSMSVGVALDPLNGLRLSTDGTQSVSQWSTTADFSGAGTSTSGPLVGQLTLDATAAGGDGALRLRTSPLALSFNSSAPVVAPSFSPTSDRGDTYELHGPAVVKVGTGDYRMWYSGVAPDGYVQRIFEATSTNGTAWSKVEGSATGGAVLDIGPESAFDEHGLVRPTVIYDASSTPPFKMFYGTLSDDAGYIGSAVSSDGVHWSKHEVSTGTAGPIVSPGLPGMADGYSVGEPSAIYDPVNKVFHMWYAAGPGPDVGGRQVGYATSTNTTADAFGQSWGKGGIVQMGGANGNWNGGWFSPGCWFEGGATPYGMIFAGKKLGDQPYKLMNTNNTLDPTSWTFSGIYLNGTGAWGGNNVYWASVLREGAGNYKVYYTGNGGTGDLARNAVGLSTWNGGGGVSDYASNPVLKSGTPSSRFDANYTANGSAVRTIDASGEPKWLMLYAGRAATDLQWRIGAAESTDLASWAKLDGTGDATRKAVFSTGGAGSFDASGALAPTLFSIDQTAGTLGVLYQAESAAGATTFGLATATAAAPLSWNRRASAVLAAGGSWDAADIAHPSVVRVGATWRCYYAGSSAGVWSIGYATSNDLVTWSKQSQVLTASVSASSTFEAGGISDPVVTYEASGTPVFRMWYTAKDSAGVERICYATSSDGVSWTRHGLTICPSEDPYSFDEIGVRAGGAAYDASSSAWQVFYTGVDRGNAGISAGLKYTTNWQRVGRMYGGAPGYIGAGSGAYECVPTGTPAPGYQYEFRAFDWDAVAPTGTAARYWVSFYPAYVQPNGTPVDAWSKYFALDNTASAPYLPLTTQKVRWKVAFARDAANTSQTPELQAFRITWAPVHFAPTGTAVSIPVTAAEGRYIDSWQQLNVTASDISADSSVSVTILAEDGQELTSPTVLGNGGNTVSLASLPLGLPSIRVRYDFSGDGQATAYIKNWSVDYTTTTRAPVSDLRGSGTPTSVVLSWVEPDYDGFLKTRVVRRPDTFALSASDPLATVVYEASATPGASIQTTDTTASAPGTVYYYTAFTSDGAGWSPPAFAIGVPGSPLTNLAASATGVALRLTWVNGTTSTVPASAWQGSRILRRNDASATTPTSPYDASATVIADVKGRSYDDSSVVSGQTYRYGAWEHYAVTISGRTYHAYSQGASAGARVTPTVTRLAGSDRYVVAVNVASAAFPGWSGVKHVIVACGEDRAAADPLAAAGLAGVYDAPILLVKSTGIPTGTYNAIKAAAAANHGLQIHIVGGPGSVPDTLKNQMAAIAWVGSVDRIGGADRYAVTANIATRMATVVGSANIPGAIIICSENPAAFFDALAASPAAYRMHMPMLGVRSTSVPTSVNSVLSSLIAGKPRYIASHTTFIAASNPARSVNAVKLTTTGDRYGTASQIASNSIGYGWLTDGEIGLAAKLPDALTGGAFMGARNGVLLFTDSVTTRSTIQSQSRTFIVTHKPNIGRGWVLGGPASVPGRSASNQPILQELDFVNILK